MLKFFMLLLCLASHSFAQDIFVIKKSMNPLNVLHFKANVSGCQLKSPAISAYWKMGEEDGHVEGLTIKEKKYFEPKISYQKSNEVDFSLGAMEEMECNIDKTVRVRLEKCQPKAYIEIDGQEVALKEIYVEVGFLLNVTSMTITGSTASGRKVNKKFLN